MSPPRDQFEDRNASVGDNIDVLGGVLIGAGLNLFAIICGIVIFATLFSERFFLIFLSFFGIIQVVYMVPLILRARRRKRTGEMKGLIIAASITFLLNAACGAALMGAL